MFMLQQNCCTLWFYCFIT